MPTALSRACTDVKVSSRFASPETFPMSTARCSPSACSTDVSEKNRSMLGAKRGWIDLTYGSSARRAWRTRSGTAPSVAGAVPGAVLGTVLGAVLATVSGAVLATMPGAVLGMVLGKVQVYSGDRSAGHRAGHSDVYIAGYSTGCSATCSAGCSAAYSARCGALYSALCSAACSAGCSETFFGRNTTHRHAYRH